MNFETVALDDKNSALVIVDQTRLPVEVVTLRLTRQQEILDAIRTLKVRGAPAIGVAAAIGLYLAAKSICADSFDAFYREFRAAKDALAATRPTAVNLFWALERMEKVVQDSRELPVLEIKRRLCSEAKAIREEDIKVCRAIGEHGLKLLHDGDGILTHCNAGRLATVKYGTALAPISL
ncbi:MAG: S-methyl-5-thioribose-1-phosphate isomerase, partial [Christensenellales bacterium]